jgi:hypothetical protein
MNHTVLTRRDWLKTAASITTTAVISARLLPSAAAVDAATPVVRDIGSRRELFVDRWLIDHLNGAQLKLHEPQLAPAMSDPANNLEYGTVIKDGDLFRLYTRDGRGAKRDGDVPEVTPYFESRDGIHWTKSSDLKSIAGKPVCLRFVMSDADLYALRFQ